MMKNKNTVVPIIVFVITFVVFLVIFFIVSSLNDEKYFCIDYEKKIKYTFKTEEKMHQFCDKLNGGEEDQVLEESDIYKDLIKVDDPGFAFYPFVVDKKLHIIIAISDCQNPNAAKERAIKWFSDNNYNINDYNVEYENSCIDN